MSLNSILDSKAWVLVAQIGAAVGLLLGVFSLVDRFSADQPRLLIEAYPANYVIAPTDNDWRTTF